MAIVTTIPHGNSINLDGAAINYTYNAAGLVSTKQASDGEHTYQQTYTYNGSNQLISQTQWVEIS
jgi:YD repeat-containing protein